MGDVKGAVLVTGASTGIGRAIVEHLDREGYRVFAGVRKDSDAQSIRAAGSERLNPVTIDVTEAESIASARGQLEAALGEQGLAGLVNNAGIASGGPVEGIPIDDFKRVVDTNLTGQVAVTQAFMPLIRRGHGRVFFITSVGGRIATPFMSPYHAAKFGLEAVADSMRREVRPWGIDVIVIEPGSIATQIWDRGKANADEARARLAPEVARLYDSQLDRMTDVIRETGERGLPPERVAKTIQRALEARRPKTRYVVGTDAKGIIAASSLLPDRFMDRLLRRGMKLPDDAPGAS